MSKNEFLKLPNASLNSYLILEEAIKRKINSKYINDSEYFILSTNKKRYTLRIDHNSIGFSHHAALIADDKFQTKQFLIKNDISVPKGYICSPIDHLAQKSAIKIFQSLQKPVVLKPAAGTYGGEGIYTNIRALSELKDKLAEYKKGSYQKIIIEEQFGDAKEYRILATREKVAGVIYRIPANIIGDGKSSIKQLIKIKNSDPNRGGHDYKKPLLKIEIDLVVKNHLKKQKLSLNNILPKNKQIFLRKNSNLSTGGDSIDYTDKIHQSVKDIAFKVVKSIPGTPYLAIDFMSKDITKKQTKDTYKIIEVNRAPMISMHHFPAVGKNRDVAAAIIDVLFPETKK